MQILKRLTSFREFVLLAVIVLAAVAMAFASPRAEGGEIIFLSRSNILAVLLGLSFESIVAIGMTILLVSGGFDLSVGSTLALSGAVTAMVLKDGAPVAAAIPVGLAVGASIGLANGLIIARIRINPFITTLGTMGIARGLL